MFRLGVLVFMEIIDFLMVIDEDKCEGGFSLVVVFLVV